MSQDDVTSRSGKTLSLDGISASQHFSHFPGPLLPVEPPRSYVARLFIAHAGQSMKGGAGTTASAIP